MKNFPVFVFPVSLEFYLNARVTHKQLLTVYNPYDFSVNFKVLCTSPNKFTVIDPEGVIAPQSCIDIVVRYTQPSVTHSDGVDKFRITMFDSNTQQALGKRDIPTKLLDGEPPSVNTESYGDSFHPIVSRATPGAPTSEHCCGGSEHMLHSCFAPTNPTGASDEVPVAGMGPHWFESQTGICICARLSEYACLETMINKKSTSANTLRKNIW
ncbi:putative motile sperm domain containing 1 [Operophtera brumata]|uniref:Putative motile sperm domain containing 1 n=1 Tax=Operophtera brumata TaxID=104452 RepID=A0A0L7KZC6_OPEBR|nr:putative motile sperm domain containing 1 [Operophtera brumata]